MLKEEQVSLIRGKGKVPEYRDNFPPELKNVYDNELVNLIGEANLAIGNLNSYARLVPNPDLLVGPLLLKEALASSRIEGTEATARDIVEHDAGIKLSPILTGRVLEVINHREATKLGLDLLDKQGFPLVNRVIKDIHKKLLLKVRGEIRRPGEFRIGSNAVARGEDTDSFIYLPPPADKVDFLMANLEKYLNDKDSDINKIVRCAIVHYEFEAIHPFADGNGRLGRVLISLFLIKEGVLEYPLLYMSGYLLREKDAYYKALLEITKQENWAAWLKFFLLGIKEQATKSRVILEKIRSLYEEADNVVKEKVKKSIYAHQLVIEVFKSPVITGSQVVKILRCEHPTAMTLLRKMVEIGVLNVDPKNRRDIPFYNEKLIKLL
ncbi:MAG: Fic family protein [Patescibacteria group bacterium]